MPEIRDAPPDESWVEPTVFRKYQYYHAHINGAKQTLLSGPSLRSQTATKPAHSNGFKKNDRCEFTVTHQVIVPSESTPNTPNIKPKTNTNNLGPIGPMMSATSNASQVSAASSFVPMPAAYNNHNESKMFVNRSYTFTKWFTGLGVKNRNVINLHDRDAQSNKSGVLNWLFASGKVDDSAPQTNNRYN